MLIKYSDNPFKRMFGIFFWNWKPMLLFFLMHSAVYILHDVLGLEQFHLPVIPVTILGGGLAIFLGFQNNAAYDRWWEARKVWGGIVNSSRTWGMQVLSFPSAKWGKEEAGQGEIEDWKKQLIYRHIAWIQGLCMHLLEKKDWDRLSHLLPPDELKQLKSKSNKPAQLLAQQGKKLSEGYEQGYIEDFRHMAMAQVIEKLYDLQGQSERIKNTVFPYYYNYFTRIFLWLFILSMPFALVPDMGWTCIPLGTAILFVFYILEKSGRITEVPFSGRAADTPILSISRNIEIDLREMLNEADLPEPMPIVNGRFGVVFQR